MSPGWWCACALYGALVAVEGVRAQEQLPPAPRHQGGRHDGCVVVWRILVLVLSWSTEWCLVTDCCYYSLWPPSLPRPTIGRHVTEARGWHPQWRGEDTRLCELLLGRFLGQQGLYISYVPGFWRDYVGKYTCLV